MADSLYIASTEANSGKSVISLGVMELLLRKLNRVGFFRPIISTDPSQGVRDADIELIKNYFNLDIPYDHMYGYTAEEAAHLIYQGRESDLLEGIISKYDHLREAHFDFILCEGTDYSSSTAAFEFDINGEISKNLGTPVLLVANGFEKSVDETVRSIDLAMESLNDKGCKTLGIIANRIDSAHRDEILKTLEDQGLTKNHRVYTIPDEPFLSKPTIEEIARKTGARVLYAEDQLHRHAQTVTVAAMQLEHFLTRIGESALIITPGDRTDVIVASLAAESSLTVGNIAGLLLTGGIEPEEPVWNLIKGFPRKFPILLLEENTYPAAMKVNSIHSKIPSSDTERISKALAVFEQNVKTDDLAEQMISTTTDTMTPKMFEYNLIQQAKAYKQHIVLPEGNEERILRAADILLKREVVDITLLGKEEDIRETIGQMGIDLTGVNIIDPAKSDKLEEYAETYTELRKNKGMTLEKAREIMTDLSFYGTMMVYKGDADGMVSGAIHSTAETIRPSLQIIKTKPGVSIVSSIFFMCLDNVLVYGDCAVNPNPNSMQLAEIALSSAQTAKDFGVDPRVAMLSYSSGASGTGEDVDKVREATQIVREKAEERMPGLLVEGPIQYDAAVDMGVAKTKLPDSKVAGRATVLVFPDLNTGNNTYKAVQRSANVIAIGPILQGLRYPVNDLSRGCLVPDIVNTIVITAIQAHMGKVNRKEEPGVAGCE